MKKMKLNSSKYTPSSLINDQTISIQQTCTGNEDVLLIQDNGPWCGDAVVTELTAQGVNFCMINSSEINATDFSQFREVIIPSDQVQAFYDNLFPGGNIHPKIVDFVQNGGILSANLADLGNNGGSWTPYTFIDGVQHVSEYQNNNNIANPAHPIITGNVPCQSGNCGQIVDIGPNQDLDNWNFSSHGYFTNLPTGTDIILVDEFDRPVMVEYPFGNGTVIATLTTSEWRYDGCNGIVEKKLLANEIAYQSLLVCNTCEPLCTDRDTDFTATFTVDVPFTLAEVGTPAFNGNFNFNGDCFTGTCLQTVMFTVCDTTLECCITLGTVSFSGTADLLISVPATLETDCGSEGVSVIGAVTVPISQTCFSCDVPLVCPDICDLLDVSGLSAVIVPGSQIEVTGTVTFNCPI
jgi:hypothetical protein